MTLGFEVFAVAVGAAGAAKGEYVPGSLVAVAVIVLLVLPSGRALFPADAAGTSHQAPVRLTPPPVVAAVPAPPALPPSAPPPTAPVLPPGLLVAASTAGVPTLPPPPPMPLPPVAPAPMPSVRGGVSGNILPRH